jgi:hypothetical protein
MGAIGVPMQPERWALSEQPGDVGSLQFSLPTKVKGIRSPVTLNRFC